MGLFDKLFAIGKKTEETEKLPPVFGRYSDNNKSAFQQEEWLKSKELYDKKKYSESLVHFFTYLRDEHIDNVIFEPNGENAFFYMYQGSKKISGTIDNNCVRASVSIARFTGRSTPAMRRLLEKNFELYYSKFYLKDDLLKLKIYNNIMASAPGKLYFALKELCIQADRLDDILVDDFEALKAEGTEHIIPCTEKELQIKYDFFRAWIDKTVTKIESLKSDTFSGGISYMMMNLVFKLDYLLLPEGKLTEKLEEINSLFWNMLEGTPASERNYRMLESLKELQQWEEADVKKYFYNTKHTFSLTKPTKFKSVIDTINSTLNNALWYRENNHEDIALEMLEYAMGYSQFSFSLPKPATQLFDIMMRVNHCDYYKAMGYDECLYNGELKAFNEELVKEKITVINEENKERYTLINVDTNALVFEDVLSFNLTLLQEIIKLDFRKKK